MNAESVDESAPRSRLALLWLHPHVRCKTLEVGQGVWRIGRGPDCEIVVHDGAVSREHAQVYRKGPLVLLKDLESANGTFVNAVRIQQIPIQPGSILRVGNWVGVFCLTAGADLSGCFGEILPGYYAGPTLREVLEPLRRAAVSRLPILIEGATGSGKERVAEYIHVNSGRTGPFHAVNCAAIPADVAESQLFGHVKGAFTGASAANLGHFRAADAGTLFLDEIAELPLEVQAKLLRVLQEQKVTPLGDTKPVSIDVRIVASCQQSLAAAVEARVFRADLRARLAGLVVELPSLAQRIEEVPFLFMRFLEQHSGGRPPAVDGKVIERLCLYDWPGNVRELELVARQLLVLHGHERVIKKAHLVLPIRQAGFAQGAGAVEPRRRELNQLAQALREAGGNITHASARLGISRSRAYRLLNGLRIEELMAQFPREPSSRLAEGAD